MGKRIVSQARGHGSLVYRVRRQGYKYRIGYPNIPEDGEIKAKIIKLIHSPAHSAPLIKVKVKYKDKEIFFYNLSFRGAFEGQEINFKKSEEKSKPGDILSLKDIEIGAWIYNIESAPGDGGKFVRASGGSAQVARKEKDKVFVMMPSKKIVEIDSRCRASVGFIAASGRLEKPMVKAGNTFYAMRAKGKRWHLTSRVKVNVVDHPFGGGRGKRIKSKIAKRNAPPGAKVGHLSPRKTGRGK